MPGWRSWLAGGSMALAATLSSAQFALAPLHAWADSSTQVLAGVNTIETSTSGVATVEVPAPATLSFDKHFGPEAAGVHGGGRIIAMVLEQNGRALARWAQISGCGTPGCTGDFWIGLTYISQRTLKPGLYHLYVAADGAPVSAVLKLGGLNGTTDVTTTAYDGITVGSLTPVVPSTGVADPGLYSASGANTIGNNGGFLLNSLLVNTASFVGAYEGDCVSPGTPPPAYLGSCSSPTDPRYRDDIGNPFLSCDPRYFCDPGFTVDAAVFGVGFFDLGGGDIHPGHGGTWGQGNYLEGPTVATAENSAGLWMSFLPPDHPKTQTASSSNATPSPVAPSPSPSPSPAPLLPTAVNLPNTSAATGHGAPAGIAAILMMGAAIALRRRRWFSS